MSEWKAKRFWKETRIEAETHCFSVSLDGRPVRTPAKEKLELSTNALAEAVAAEWDAQEDEINPHKMPFTRMANSAIDKVKPQHGAVADMLTEYGDSDLLCYRAESSDPLSARQAEIWDPYLQWADQTLGVRLSPVSGLMHTPQDQAAIAKARELVLEQDAFQLAAFHDLVCLTGSLVLGFAATRDVSTPDEIWAASRCDELWQIEQWGEDEEAAEVARIKAADFRHAKRFWDMARRH